MDPEFRNTAERTRLDIDPDVRHLLELLSLLPWPVLVPRRSPAPTPVHQRMSDFWREYAKQPPKQANAGYYVSNLSVWPALMTEPGHGTDEDVRRLAEYCLMFFELDPQENAARLELLDTNLDGAEITARRWVADVCATAWRLYAPREARRHLHALASEIAGADRVDLIPPPGAQRTLIYHGYAGEYTVPLQL